MLFDRVERVCSRQAIFIQLGDRQGMAFAPYLLVSPANHGPRDCGSSQATTRRKRLSIAKWCAKDGKSLPTSTEPLTLVVPAP